MNQSYPGTYLRKPTGYWMKKPSHRMESKSTVTGIFFPEKSGAAAAEGGMQRVTKKEKTEAGIRRGAVMKRYDMDVLIQIMRADRQAVRGQLCVMKISWRSWA